MTAHDLPRCKPLGVVLSFTRTPVWFRVMLIAVPFVAIWGDIGSWWLTTYAPIFADTVIIGGVFMGVSLARQMFMSLSELWVAPDTKSIS